jgi:predicted PurR-regulated permease PerM
VDRVPKLASPSLVVLATLAVIAALYLLKPILIPVALALVLACMLSPLTTLLRRILPLSPTGAAVVLFLLTVLCGLYVATLTAESLVQAANTLPSDVERLSGQVSHRIHEMVRDHPFLRGILPEPGTIDLLGDANRAMLIDSLSYGLADLSIRAAQGLFILILVLFLLAESEMLTPKVIRFFAATPRDAEAAGRSLANLTSQIRAYLVARTLINLGFGAVIAVALWALKVKYSFALGIFAALTNYIPYVGQLIGGALPTLMTLGQTGSLGDALIVAAVYLAVVGLEGYVITPFVMGRSLDMNGTTVLIACLFWGFLWGLVGLVLAMPIAVSMKLVFQTVPELNRWAELMSRDWQKPRVDASASDLPPPPEPDSPGPPGAESPASETAIPHAGASAR